MAFCYTIGVYDYREHCEGVTKYLLEWVKVVLASLGG